MRQSERHALLSEERSFGRGDPVRDYWLAHAEGFRLADTARTLGVVERVDGDRANPADVTLRVRRGAMRGDAVVSAAEVEEVVPAQKLLVLRQDPQADGGEAKRDPASARALRRLGPVADRALRRSARAIASGARAVIAFAGVAAAALEEAVLTRAVRRETRDHERARRRRRRSEADALANRPDKPTREDDAPADNEDVAAWEARVPPTRARPARRRR